MHSVLSSKVKLAISMCVHYHALQKRKYTGEPYWHHPIEVAAYVSVRYPDAEDMIIAAILHDTVEDTKLTLIDIHEAFGNAVTDLVEGLTDVSKPSDGKRAHRKALDREHSWNASKEAQDIKLCDCISNAVSIIQCDPNFSVVYTKEIIKLIEGLKDPDALFLSELDTVLRHYKELGMSCPPEVMNQRSLNFKRELIKYAESLDPYTDNFLKT